MGLFQNQIFINISLKSKLLTHLKPRIVFEIHLNNLEIQYILALIQVLGPTKLTSEICTIVSILVSSWDKDFPMLKIVTSLPVANEKSNITVIRGDWHTQALTDLKMRDLYCNSEFVILPLKETMQPSGQSTCLQAMSCSKAVLISNIKGIWDRELLKNNENIIFTKTGNVQELRKSIQFLFKNLKFREKIGENGRKLVVEHFNIINMKNKLLESFEDI